MVPSCIKSSIPLTWFVAIHNQLDKTFIGIFSGVSVPEIKINVIPAFHNKQRKSDSSLRSYLPPALILTTLFTAAKIIKVTIENYKLYEFLIQNVSMERESRLRETMRIMGLSNTAHWTAWLTSSLFIPIGTYTQFSCASK